MRAMVVYTASLFQYMITMSLENLEFISRVQTIVN